MDDYHFFEIVEMIPNRAKHLIYFNLVIFVVHSRDLWITQVVIFFGHIVIMLKVLHYESQKIMGKKFIKVKLEGQWYMQEFCYFYNTL